MRTNVRPALTVDGRLLRPSRATAPRSWRSRRRLLGLLPRLIWTLVGAALLCGGGLAVLIMLRESAIFRVERPELIGARHLEPAALERRLAAQMGRSIFDTDPQAILRALRREPYVARAVVRRQLPNRLVIEIEERAPAAWGSIDGRWRLLDANGLVLGAAGAPPPGSTLPQVLRLDPSDPERMRAALRAALQAQRSLSAAGLTVQALEAAHPDQVSASLPDRSYRLLIGAGDAPGAVRRYLELRGAIDARSETFDTVDLRFRDQVVLRNLQPRGSEHE
ncbi:MAG TPA: FtsQ-type POTRA domain-containing protein [Acidobacteriota bacterium]